MKQTATLLAFISLVYPAHAASPRACRTVAARVNHSHIVNTAHVTNHYSARSQFVVTAFAVPVAVPVAPFAPYWYGVSDYYDVPSFPGSAWERTARESLPHENPREAKPRRTNSQATASEPARSLVTQHCTSCHGRTSPKQGLSLVDLPSLNAEDRLRALRAVFTGAMPPDTEPSLTNAQRDALLRELLNETPTKQNENDQ
jgi:mono/diheme cytochrome c family protein